MRRLIVPLLLTTSPAFAHQTLVDGVKDVGSGGVTSPEQFFRFRGNAFVSGAPTTIAPGQSATVTGTLAFDRVNIAASR